MKITRAANIKQKHPPITMPAMAPPDNLLPEGGEGEGEGALAALYILDPF
jgi:hypothetical protein